MGRVTSFDYSGINPSTLTGTVVVTDPDGNETGYTYNEGTLPKRRLATGPPAVSTTYAVDASTLLDDSVTDPNNNTTS